MPRFLLAQWHIYSLCRPLSATKTSRIAHKRLPTFRHASASAPKTIRLEKPTKFVPPSHGKRLKQQILRHYGPQLTQTQKAEQATKKYPNMMPPPGTFMFWFLTSRGIHTFISMVGLLHSPITFFHIDTRSFANYSQFKGVLVLLASFTAYENWKRDTPFREQLPTGSEFLSHPIASCSQVIEIYKMHAARTSVETAERRKRGVEDVQKRSTYRRAHGLESEDSQGLGGWTARSDDETLGPSLTVEGPISRRPINAVAGESAESDPAATGGKITEAAYGDREGRKKPVKKWLGIW